MAEFITAYKRVLKNEGGYSNAAFDKGGSTYCGISRKAWPHWSGWPIVDKHKPLKTGEVIHDSILDGLVKQFYKTNFWDKVRGDNISSQLVAEFCFDFAVNSGGAVKVIQSAVNAVPDGKFGPATLSAINTREEHALMTKLKKARIDYVNEIVREDPTQKKFLAGWLKRISSF